MVEGQIMVFETNIDEPANFICEGCGKKVADSEAHRQGYLLCDNCDAIESIIIGKYQSVS